MHRYLMLPVAVKEEVLGPIGFLKGSFNFSFRIGFNEGPDAIRRES